ncbi:uncharacterized protein LOC128739848 [Sabethes cyaneus]|uniref:uncharacterized protein LOC128739848 n=1 Tax=Sabethes cyaneus TaxID=53552 RepID=UPI00237D8ECF|nr:uncharacterized protein LOC128739848 [Sabethes cyaneus]
MASLLGKFHFLFTLHSSEQETILTESLLENGLMQIFNLPNQNGRLLDLAFVNNVNCCEILEPPSPILRIDVHHVPFILILDVRNTDSEKSPDVWQYDFSRCDYNVINDAIANINWHNLLEHCPTDEAVLRFYNSINLLINEHVPVKKLRKMPNNHQPWWNPELNHSRNRLRKARKRFFKHRSDHNKQSLHHLEQQYEANRNACFREYINRIESKVKQEPSSFWHFAQSRKHLKGIPSNLLYRDRKSSKAEDSVNLFADFFKTVYCNDPPTTQREAISNVRMLNLFLPSITLSTGEVASALAAVDSSKGPGPDGLPPLFLKQSATALAKPLTMIFNSSLTSGVFPSIWKHASITPIHKSGSRNNIENYRGISILNSISKVFEKIVHHWLYSAVHNRNAYK